jgi:hypothetical protein
VRGTGVILVLLVGAGAIFAEIRPVKEYSLFFSWINSAPIVFTCIMAGVYLVLNIIGFVKQGKLASFLPFVLSLILVFVLFALIQHRETLDNAPTRFFADAAMIGNDGGTRFDFKENGHLKGERHDQWVETFYWGTYQEKNDTILLDIPLNFKLGRKALLTDSLLKFIDDTVALRVVRPLETK